MDYTKFAYLGNVFNREAGSSAWKYEQRKLFCPCGYSLEFEPNFVQVQDNPGDLLIEIREKKSWGPTQHQTGEFAHVECPNCSVVYYHLDQLVRIDGSKHGNSIVRRTMWYFVRDNKHALVTFLRQAVVSSVTRKLFFKNSRIGLYINDITKRIYVKYPGMGLFSIGLRNIQSKLNHYITKYNVANYCHIPTKELIENDIFIGIDKMIAAVRQLVDSKDIDRLDERLNELTYYREVDFSSWYHNEICKRTDKLALYSACMIYPPLATIAINMGAKYLFELLECKLLAPPKVLRESKATNHRDILSSIVRHHLEKDMRNKKFNERLDEKINILTLKNKQVKKAVTRRKNSRVIAKLSKTKKHHLNFIHEEWRGEKLHKHSHVSKKIIPLFSAKEIIEVLLKYAARQLTTPLEQLVELFPPKMVFMALDVSSVDDNDRLFVHMLRVYTEKYNNKGFADINNFHLYADTVRMIEQMEEDYADLLRCRNYNELENYHNKTMLNFKLKQSESLNAQFENVSSVISKFDILIDGINFEHIATPQQIIFESDELHHCISSYAHRVAHQQYMAFRVSGEGVRATLGINIENGTPVFDQLKATRNSKCEVAARLATVKFMNKHNFMIRSESAHDLLFDNESKVVDEIAKMNIKYVTIKFPQTSTKPTGRVRMQDMIPNELPF